MEPGQRAGSGESGSGLPHSKAFGGGVYGEGGWQAHSVRWEGIMRQASSGFFVSALSAPASPAPAGQIETRHGHRWAVNKKTGLSACVKHKAHSSSRVLLPG
jgi:hypothetical protein